MKFNIIPEKLKEITFITIILTFLVFQPLASADVIGPGMKPFDWSYEVENLDQYPDYVFMISEDIPGQTGPKEIIRNGEEFDFYKNGNVYIYSMKKNEFETQELKNKQIKADDPRLIKSDIKLDGYGAIPFFSPLKSIEINLKIKNITENGLNVDVSEAKYDYGFYTATIEGGKNQVPEPNPLILSIGYITQPIYLAGIAFLGIIIVFIKRYRGN